MSGHQRGIRHIQVLSPSIQEFDFDGWTTEAAFNHGDGESRCQAPKTLSSVLVADVRRQKRDKLKRNISALYRDVTWRDNEAAHLRLHVDGVTLSVCDKT